MILPLDDFHNINAIRLPTKLMLVAVHMGSSLVDIHSTIPALCIPDKKELIHSSPAIKEKDEGEVSKKYVGEELLWNHSNN